MPCERPLLIPTDSTTMYFCEGVCEKLCSDNSAQKKRRYKILMVLELNYLVFVFFLSLVFNSMNDENYLMANALSHI
jgi:hypothetical protein